MSDRDNHPNRVTAFYTIYDLDSALRADVISVTANEPNPRMGLISRPAVRINQRLVKRGTPGDIFRMFGQPNNSRRAI